MRSSAVLGAVARSGALAAIVLVLVVAIGAGLGVDGVAILYFSVWIGALLAAAVGAFLIARARRPIAGAGALIAAVAAWLPFFWRSSPSGIVWTIAFILGVGLIAWGTRQDTDVPLALPLLIARFTVGWAFLDNAVNDQVWVPSGGGFLSTANAAAGRAPLDFIDPTYHAFLSGSVIPHAGTWAGLFLGGEFAFGLLVAIGLFTPVAAWGAMWLSANIVLEKSFITHGTYVDKTYFLLETVCLITGAGRAYGLDAVLRHSLPPVAMAPLTGAAIGAPSALEGRGPARVASA